MKLYVSGPMRGIPRYNFPMFDSLAAWLATFGIDSINPADHDRAVEPDVESTEHYLHGDPALKPSDEGERPTFHDLIGWDLRQIASPECDGIVLMPGWERSVGANHERYVAEATGKSVWLASFAATSTGDDGVTIVEDWSMERDDDRSMTTLGAQPQSAGGEVRVVDPTTGGAKGSKLARFDLLPYDALYALAEHFGKGAEKYEERNWERGYDWKLSFAAAMRHGTAWWQGEELDDEGFEHLTAFAWHALVLLAFSKREIGTDSRPCDARV